MNEQIKQKGRIVAILGLVLIIVNVAQIFIPFLKFVGKVEMGGSVVETLTVNISLFDVIKGGNVKVLSSLSSEFSREISVDSLWPSSNDYAGACIMIVIVGINLLVSLGLIGFSILTKGTNKHHLFYFNSAWLVFIAISTMICMFGYGTTDIFTSVDFSGFACEFPVVWVIILALINFILDFVFSTQIKQIEIFAVEEFIDKFKNKNPELQMSILEGFQNCVLRARWKNASDILETTGDKESRLYTKIQEKNKQKQPKD